MNNNNSVVNKKRVRAVDSVLDPAESKRVRVDSDESPADLSCPRDSRFDSAADSDESALDSEEARLLQDDLLNILDSSDSVADREPAIQDLDSVIKSFEEEIISAPESRAASVSGESQPELGYLLEASDDELGLPPTSELAGESRIEASDFETGPAGVVLDGAFFFDDEIPSYGSLEYGIGAESDDSGFDYVALGGLFDGWDVGYETGAVSWRSESLPAL